MPKDQARSSDALPAKRGRGRPEHEPTKVERDLITVMIAGGITQADIARSRGIDLKTLRKHYRPELDNGKTSIDAMVLVEHIKLISGRLVARALCNFGNSSASIPRI
jgi:DNA invertase Pin-like site-specific DNA recombinase